MSSELLQFGTAGLVAALGLAYVKVFLTFAGTVRDLAVAVEGLRSDLRAHREAEVCRCKTK